MIVFKKAISRRAVLRGIGATLALPLLDSMVPAFTARAATPANPINRFGVVYVPNGMIMQNYLPATEGTAYELTPTLSALAPFRDQVQVLSGLNCIPPPGRPGGAHAKASTRFLTDISPPTSETWLDAGISVDQILAQETGKHTQLASLELAIESGETAGSCDTGYACPYTNTISWKSASTPLPTQNNPRLMFERLFGDSSSTDPKERLSRMRQQKSILDSVTQEVAHLQGALPQSDRTKLTEYLDAIRGVERRIQIAESRTIRQVPLVDHPVGIPAELGRPRQVDVRFAGAGVSMRSHARHHHDAGPRTERHDLSADRRARCASSDFAPPAGAREGREDGQDQCVSRDDVRVLAGEAAGDARWRRHAAGSHDVDLRRRHCRQQHSRAGEYSLRFGRRRRGQS